MDDVNELFHDDIELQNFLETKMNKINQQEENSYYNICIYIVKTFIVIPCKKMISYVASYF